MDGQKARPGGVPRRGLVGFFFLISRKGTVRARGGWSPPKVHGAV